LKALSQADAEEKAATRSDAESNQFRKTSNGKKRKQMVVNVDEEERKQGVKEAKSAAARRLSASDFNPSRIQEGQGSDVSPMDLLMNSMAASTKLISKR